jgi:hypothetical protein
MSMAKGILVIDSVKSWDIKWTCPGNQFGEFVFFLSKNLLGIQYSEGVSLNSIGARIF